MTIYKKINAVRKQFHSQKLKKTGRNDYAKYDYFELGDFLIPAMNILDEHGLCALISFTKELATMQVIDVETNESFTITSPFGSAQLKGTHEIQNIGACETYQRRYLWVALLEIIEHDALDSVTGDPKQVAKPAVVAARVTPDQAAELETFALDVGVDMSAFKKHFAFQSFADIPASKYQDILAALKKKAAVAA